MTLLVGIASLDDKAYRERPSAEERSPREGMPSTTDMLALYLEEIGAIPLLTTEEEATLVRRAHQGGQRAYQEPDERADMQGNCTPSRTQESEDARRKIIESNLRLVVSIASRYNGRGVPLPDLIREGNLGLLRATEKFDYRKGFRFSTYATWWIRQAVTRGLANQRRSVRIPVHIMGRASQISDATRRLSQELGREPTQEEIARETDLSAEQVQQAAKASLYPISLDQPIGPGYEPVVAELPEDGTEACPEDLTLRKLLCEEVRAALRGLTCRERRVICLRFGLGVSRDYTLEQIGRELGLTRERVRQIEMEALDKLRHDESFSESLRAFLR